MENNINKTYLNPNAIQDHSIHSDKLDSNSFKTINGQSIIGGPGEIVVGGDSPTTNLNLIKDSNFESISVNSKTSDPWLVQVGYGNSNIDITYDYNKRCNVLKAQNIKIRQYLSNLKPSTYYTLSFSFTENYYNLKSYIFLGLNLDYASVTISSSDISYSFSSTGTTITLKGRGNNECKKVSITFKTSTSLNDSPYIELQNTNSTTPTSGILEIDSIKLEEGQIATGYSKHDLDEASSYAVLSKQDKLLSGTTIKTINNKSILGPGNIQLHPALPMVSDESNSRISLELSPNVFYKFGSVDYITFTLGTETSGIVNEYLFQFTANSNSTTFGCPDGITWEVSAPTMNANSTYQVSILNGFGIYTEFKLQV